MSNEAKLIYGDYYIQHTTDPVMAQHYKYEWSHVDGDERLHYEHTVGGCKIDIDDWVSRKQADAAYSELQEHHTIPPARGI